MSTTIVRRLSKETLKHVGWNLGLIIVGCTICGVGINGILIPREFVSGGVTGLALVIHYLAPRFDIGVLDFLLNVPLFVLGWKFVGRRFFLWSVVGMLIFTAVIQWVHVPIPVNDKLLSALLAGIVMGAGSGIILRSVGSAGGSDILSVILLKRFSIRLGTTVLAFNSAVLLAAAVLFSLENALFTLIYMYVSSHILNLVVTGLSQRKAVLIISKYREDIARGIIHEMNRGITMIPAKGGYTGEEGNLIYTVVSFRELARLKRLINAIDQNAFVVITDTLEVMGHRIGNQPHW
jgi:uncharacterized membrane-anchored protein YitT (DUF2179 family)